MAKNNGSNTIDHVALPVAVVLALAIFAADTQVELGVVVEVPYVAVILLGLWISRRWFIPVATIGCSALIIAGIYKSPPLTIDMWKVSFNRGLSLLVVCITGILCFLQKTRVQTLIDKLAHIRSLELLNEVASTANESTEIEEALKTSIEQICRIIAWPVGHAYIVDTSDKFHQKLTPYSVWHLDDPVKYGPFKEISDRTPFSKGIGLPGRVWASGKPEWIADTTKDENFPRAYGNPPIGIRAGFAFPIFFGESTLAVLEFFSSEVVEPDSDLLLVMSRMGTSLGHLFERKRIEEELELYRSQLERLVEERTKELVDTRNSIDQASAIAFVMTAHIGLDGRWLKVPNSLCKFLGYSEEEMLSREFKDITHPDDIMNNSNQYQRVIAGEIKSFDLEKRYIRKNGKTVWVYLNCSIVKDGNGKPIHLLAYIQDIDKRKSAELNQQRLIKILENTQDFVGYVDATTTGFLFINRAGRFMTGFEESEDVTKFKIADVHPESTNHLFRDKIFPIAKREGLWVGECELLHKDGHTIPVLMTLIAHKSENGEIDVFSTNSRDISRLKHNENKLKNSLLEKEILLKEIGHRIKNNMEIISSLIKIQLNSSREASFRKMAQDLDNRIFAMSSIYDQIFHSKVLNRLIDAQKHISRLTRNIMISFGEYNKNCVLNIEAHGVYLNVDSSIYCGLIINELVTNSLKYAYRPDQKKIINVSLRLENEHFELIIQDYGKGIGNDIDIYNVASMGMPLVIDLVKRQLLGEIEMIKDGGTTFKIIFPKRERNYDGQKNFYSDCRG